MTKQITLKPGMPVVYRLMEGGLLRTGVLIERQIEDAGTEVWVVRADHDQRTYHLDERVSSIHCLPDLQMRKWRRQVKLDVEAGRTGHLPESAIRRTERTKTNGRDQAEEGETEEGQA